MMWSKPGPRPTGVNFFEKVVIPYGALLFVRQWRGFGPVPSTTFKGSWYDSVTKRISLFHGSLGTDSQAVFHNGSLPLLPVTNATSAFNVSPYVFNGSMLMKSQDFNGSPLKAVPTDPWNYRESNFPDMTLTLKDFYWSSRSARDFVDRAIDARIRIFLEVRKAIVAYNGGITRADLFNGFLVRHTFPTFYKRGTWTGTCNSV